MYKCEVSVPWAQAGIVAAAPHWTPRGRRTCWSGGGETGRG